MSLYCYCNAGSIIAVDYEARKYGVSRLVKGNEAKKLCPEINLVRVPEKRGKANLENYRRASMDVMTVLSRFSSIIERASIDEAFLDITAMVEKRIDGLGFNEVNPNSLPSTHVAGFIASDNTETQQKPVNDDNDHNRHTFLSDWLIDEGNNTELTLTVGALITLEIRRAVLRETGFTCSAGIAHNKVIITR